MKRIIITLVLAIAALAPASAQNTIDEIVDKFSAIGDCRLTSVVSRNPKTRSVEKVIKVLTINGKNAKKMIDIFRKEQDKNTYIKRTENANDDIVLVRKNSKDDRIYMLHSEDSNHYPTAKVTIIIKMK